MFEVHEVVDKTVMKPLIDAYIAAVPKLVRTGVSNFFNNIDDLFSGVNALLQGKPDKAGNDFGRVMLNTFVMFGIFDVASDMGIERGGEDFGQTFGVWGFPQGPYLFVPVFGPTTFRDGTGVIVRIAVGPVGYIPDVADAQHPVRHRRRRHPRAGGRRHRHGRHGVARQVPLHPQCLPAAAAVSGLRRQAAAGKRGRMMQRSIERLRRAAALIAGPGRDCAAVADGARAGGPRCPGQARVGRRDRDDQGRPAGAGRQPGAHPRGDGEQAHAELRLRADDGAGDGPQLARRDARAAAAADRRVPDAAGAHLLRRAHQVPRRGDRVQAAAGEPRRHRRHRAHRGAEAGRRADPDRLQHGQDARRAGRPTT